MTVNSDNEYVVTVNAGSSSLKLAAFSMHGAMHKVFEAVVENIGQASASLTTAEGTEVIDTKDHLDAATTLIDRLNGQFAKMTILAVGHRIVHGGPKYHKPQLATNEVLADLQELTPFDPQHLPTELRLVKIFQTIVPNAEQVLCFDTAFHHDLPTTSRLLPIPRHFEAQGLRRYGFHGLSYAYILEELRRVEGETAANGKVIIAHLGSGASLAALNDRVFCQWVPGYSYCTFVGNCAVAVFVVRDQINDR